MGGKESEAGRGVRSLEIECIFSEMSLAHSLKARIVFEVTITFHHSAGTSNDR